MRQPHLCFLGCGRWILPQASEPGAGMISLWGLCSAWSVPLWLQSDSLLEEFNLHHTPHRSSLPFYQSIFRGINPSWLVSAWSEMHHSIYALRWTLMLKVMPWLFCIKAKHYLFCVMILCMVYHGSAQSHCKADTVSELVNPLKSWFWPSLSTRSKVSLLPQSEYHREETVREMHKHQLT